MRAGPVRGCTPARAPAWAQFAAPTGLRSTRPGHGPMQHRRRSCRGSPRRSSFSRSRKPWRWWTHRRPRSLTRRLAWSPTCSAPAPRRCSRARPPRRLRGWPTVRSLRLARARASACVTCSRSCASPATWRRARRACADAACSLARRAHHRPPPPPPPPLPLPPPRPRLLPHPPRRRAHRATRRSCARRRAGGLEARWSGAAAAAPRWRGPGNAARRRVP